MNCEAVLGRAVNIGNIFEISIADTERAIAEAIGVEVEVLPDPARMRLVALGVEQLFAGLNLAKALFNWAPDCGSRDGFLRGLAETSDWFRNPANLALYRTDRFND
jgi:dTDP-glucose 4,6-dehydratase